MKRTLILAAVLFGAFVPAASGRAAHDLAVCTGDFEVSISPGLSLTPGSATYTTDGDAGTFACVGFIAGKQVTGAGTLAAAGVFGLFTGAVCPQGVGGGTFFLTVPTTDGPMKVMSDYTFSWAGPAGALTGSTMSGTFEFTPIEGDCISTPVTRATIHTRGVLQIP
jgi:hypothetical protein